MNVQMHNRLSGSRAVVYPDIEAVRPKTIVALTADLFHQLKKCEELIVAHFKQRDNMPPRDNQCMSGGNRVEIGNGKSQAIFSNKIHRLD